MTLCVSWTHFGDLRQHTWRKMAEYDSPDLRGLMKVFEDGSKLV